MTDSITFRVRARVSGRRRTVAVKVYDDVNQLRLNGNGDEKQSEKNND